MDPAEAKDKIANYKTDNIKSETLRAILSVLKDIESRVTALEE